MSSDTAGGSSDDNLRKNQGLYDIVAVILNICLQETSKGRIHYESKLGTQGLAAYIELLEQSELVQFKGGKYLITEKGREYLKSYNAIMAMLNEPLG